MQQPEAPRNLPKKTTGRNVRKPNGPVRFDPQSEELEIKRAEREEMKRRKDQNNDTNEKRKSSEQSQGQGLRRSKRRK